MSKRTAKVTDLNARSLTLPSGSKPSVACSKDFRRPTLMHGHLITYNGDRWLITTDAYICVALKVTASATVEDGVVPIRVLQLMEQRKRVEQVSPGVWRHVRQDDCEVVYDLSKAADKIKRPDVENIADGLLFNWPTDPPAGDEFGVNGAFLGRLAAALGTDGLRVHPTGLHQPIAIEALNGPERRALAMPIRLYERTVYDRAAA